jgi:hypothetical protein
LAAAFLEHGFGHAHGDEPSSYALARLMERFGQRGGGLV